MSDGPAIVGICQADVAACAQVANKAQRRLTYAKEVGETGWWGSWAEVVFQVTKTNPYLTCPRSVARIEVVDVCNRPIQLNNQFFEYMQFGEGRMPKTYRPWRPYMLQAYTRNNVPTFNDLSPAPQFITCYLTDTTDIGKRVLIQGTDNNGNVIYSQDGLNQVNGIYLNLTTPFVTSPVQFNTITGIQKDLTLGNVQIFQTSPTTGAQSLLVTMEPSEMTASYRRYLFDPVCWTNWVRGCCQGTTPDSVLITAIVKLDLIPVQIDQDYLLIQNLEALIEECKSIRYGNVDNTASKAMAQAAHIDAIRLLNGELGHFMGINEPAVQFAPFGNARLRRQRVGLLM